MRRVSNRSLTRTSMAFLTDLDRWMSDLTVAPFSSVIPAPQSSAILSVDVIDGFCTEGTLASPRVGEIVTPIVSLMKNAWQHGLRQIVLIQDTHEPDAVEFGAWAPHCVRGTPEAETVAAIKALTFYEQLVIMPKNSIHSALNTDLNAWLTSHHDIENYIVVGDCTDLCTYQLAMHLLLDANSRQVKRRVIVPVNCVQTYDRSVEAAHSEGGMAHPGDLMHAVFLYHMALNGVEVVKELTLY